MDQLVNEDVVNGVGRKLISSYYKYNDICVPRVSIILKDAIGSQELMDWAANVGRNLYHSIRDTATEVGTIAHEAIDEYLLGDMNFFDNIKVKSENQKVIKQASNAVMNFLKWESNLNKNGYTIDEILGIEVPVITPYYGGTIDAIIRINGAVYIIDFKTSKSIIFNYPLQACAYMLGVNNGYCDIKVNVDGIGIIRLDKTTDAFEDYFLNRHIPVQMDQINQYTNCFISILNSYYHINNAKVLNKEYRIGSEEAIIGDIKDGQ